MMKLGEAEEVLIVEESELAEDDLLKEAWPIPPDDYVKEFEQYLMDIGVRL